MPHVTKYMIVRQYVIDQIIKHKDLEAPLMSERDLCHILNVTRITIRKALKIMADEGLIISKHGKGNFVNPMAWGPNQIALGDIHKIMLVFYSGKQVFFDNFMMNVNARVSDTLKQYPTLLQFGNFIGNGREIQKEEEMYFSDAVIWFRPPQCMLEVIAEIRKKIPVCILGNPVSGDSFSVTTDYKKAGAMAAEWFIHRKLFRTMYVGHNPNSPVLKDFAEGWFGVWEKCGFSGCESRTIGSMQDIRKILSGKNDFDALFCHTAVFHAVFQVLKEQHKENCPVMLDGAHTLGEDYLPAAELSMLSSEVVIDAAEQIYRSLNEPDFVSGETIFQPSIINHNKR